MNAGRRLVIAAGLASLVAGCGASPSSTSTAIPATAAIPSPSTAAAQRTGPRTLTIGVPLDPGTYVSSVFDTPLTFTVPAGWKVFEDEPGQFGLARLLNDGPCVCVWRDVRASASKDCEEVPESGVGTSAKEIADWLARHPGLQPSTAQPVTVGGLTGYVLDLVIDPTWATTCPARGTEPRVPTLVGSGISTGVAWDVSPTDSQRLYLLDLSAPATNIAINVDVCCGVSFEAQVAAAEQVIATFAFAE